MKHKLSIKEIIAVGSMLFGLFFGAGNLIFPVHMGQLAGSQSILASLGFIVTGAGLPLLGVVAMGISRSDSLQEMASHVGKGYSVFFSVLLLLTIGPFFAIPRCATTAFTVGIEPLFTNVNSQLLLLMFSVFYFALVLAFSLKPSGILKWIGKIINPIFLVLLGILIVMSIVKPMGSITSVEATGDYVNNAFFAGFLEGYNTMDALTGITFGIIVINSIRELGVKEPTAVAKNTIKAGVVSCGLMGIIYLLITLMGAKSMGVLTVSENGGIALSEIAVHYFGKFGLVILALTVFLAVFKTSVGLITSCSEIFHDLFKKVSYKAWAIIFTVISLVLANLGLTSIIAYSLPVLMFLYPLAITLILLCLWGKTFKYDKKVFICVTAFTIVPAIVDACAALPEATISALHLNGFINTMYSILPLSNIGLGWVVPAAIGLIIGIILHVTVKKPLATN